MSVQRDRAEEEKLIIEAMKNGIIIDEAAVNVMRIAQDRINGINKGKTNDIKRKK